MFINTIEFKFMYIKKEMLEQYINIRWLKELNDCIYFHGWKVEFLLLIESFTEAQRRFQYSIRFQGLN